MVLISYFWHVAIPIQYTRMVSNADLLVDENACATALVARSRYVLKCPVNCLIEGDTSSRKGMKMIT